MHDPLTMFLGSEPKTFGLQPKTSGSKPKTLGSEPKTCGSRPKNSTISEQSLAFSFAIMFPR
jgi:hypothetical protein